MISKEHFTIKNSIFLLSVVLLLIFIFKIKVIALLFFASYIITSALAPIVDKLETKRKMNRTMATGLTLFSAITISVLFFIPIIIISVNQIKSLVPMLPEKINNIWNILSTQHIFGYNFLELIKPEQLFNSIELFTGNLVNFSLNLTIEVTQVVLFAFAICMMVFYMLADKNIIDKYFLKLFPTHMKQRAEELENLISKKVGGFVIAQILNMIAIGLLVTIFMLILRVDYAITLGLITGVLDLIPIIGPTFGLIACLVVSYHKGLLFMLLVLIAYLLAQWISNNVVRPVIFGKFLDLHPLVIIFALLVGAQFLGLWGVILAPAIAAMLCVLFEELYIKTINKSE